VRPARARASVSGSTYGSHLVFYLSLWAIRTPGCGSFGFLLYPTPLLFRFLDARSAGTPALRARPTSAVLQDAVGGLKREKETIRGRFCFLFFVFFFFFARTMNFILIHECTAVIDSGYRETRKLRILFLRITNYTRRSSPNFID